MPESNFNSADPDPIPTEKTPAPPVADGLLPTLASPHAQRTPERSMTPPGGGADLQQYRYIGLLGCGGMGEVYEYFDTLLQTPVAIKRLRPSIAEDPSYRERFLREARSLAKLRHPNIVQIYCVLQKDTLYLVQEKLEGQSLEQLLKTTKRVPSSQLIPIAIELAKGLAVVHQQRLLHRDIKPSNIWLCDEGGVKLLDFGIARLADEERNLTAHGMIVGTLSYMSPEQVEGGAIDQRSDLFSLGAVLYEMATGHRAFGGNSSLSILQALAKDTPDPNLLQEAGIAPALSNTILALLSKKPDQRIQTASELECLLKKIADAIQGPRPQKRRPYQIAGLVLVSVCILICIVLLGPTSSPTPSPQPTATPADNVAMPLEPRYVLDKSNLHQFDGYSLQDRSVTVQDGAIQAQVFEPGYDSLHTLVSIPMRSRHQSMETEFSMDRDAVLRVYVNKRESKNASRLEDDSFLLTLDPSTDSWQVLRIKSSGAQADIKKLGEGFLTSDAYQDGKYNTLTFSLLDDNLTFFLNGRKLFDQPVERLNSPGKQPKSLLVFTGLRPKDRNLDHVGLRFRSIRCSEPDEKRLNQLLANDTLPDSTVVQPDQLSTNIEDPWKPIEVWDASYPTLAIQHFENELAKRTIADGRCTVEFFPSKKNAIMMAAYTVTETRNHRAQVRLRSSPGINIYFTLEMLTSEAQWFDQDRVVIQINPSGMDGKVLRMNRPGTKNAGEHVLMPRLDGFNLVDGTWHDVDFSILSGRVQFAIDGKRIVDLQDPIGVQQLTKNEWTIRINLESVENWESNRTFEVDHWKVFEPSGLK